MSGLEMQPFGRKFWAAISEALNIEIVISFDRESGPELLAFHEPKPKILVLLMNST